MDLAYRTLCDSPAPTTAVLCNLPFSKTPCIATASETKLQIYSLIDRKLTLVWEKNYWAKIIAIFAHHEVEYDSLILVCDISKVVVLKPVGNIDLQETEFHQFHQFESDEPESVYIHNPTKAIIDPKDTCIALLVGISTIYFLTLSQPEGFDFNKRPIITTGQHSKWETINGAISFDLIKDYKPSIYRVRDIKFLEGYNRPTLAILHEPIPTWSVRLPLQKSTVTISITSPLLIEREGLFIKEQSISWSSRPLPHNAMKLIPVPSPHGGFIILCKNSIIYMTHTSGLAYGLNALARIDDECPFELCGEIEGAYEIKSGVNAIIDATHILITVDEYHPALLTLHTNGIDITGLSLFVDTEFEFYPSVLLKYIDNYYFSGSVIEDSTMLQLAYEFEEQETSVSDTSELSEAQLQLYELMYDSAPISAPKILIKSFNVSVVSKIYQLGTVTCATPFINISEQAYIQGQEDAISMALGCGYKKSGCLQFLRLSLTPNLLHESDLPDIVASFASNKFNFILFSTSSSTSFYSIYPEFKDDTENRRDIISVSDPTIAGKDFMGAFMQITPSCVKLFNEEKVLSIWYPLSGNEIKQALIVDNYAVVVVDQTVFICDGNEIEIDENGMSTSNLPFNAVIIHSNVQTNKPPAIYRIAIYEDYLFMLQMNNTLYIYSIVNHSAALIIDQFRYFHDSFYKNIENSSAYIQTSLVIDMNIINIGTLPVLVLIMKEGNIILYQIKHDEETDDFVLRRIKTRKLTSCTRTYKYSSIIQFNDINGFTGGFICGEKPLFLLAESGYPRLIQTPEGVFFTQYKNNFFYGDSKSVKLANFDNLISTETHIIDGAIVQRKMINQTPRTMTYAAPWNSLMFFASHPIPFSHENEPDIDEEAHLTPHYQRPPTPPRELPEDNFPTAYEEQYSLFVYSSNGIKEELVLDRHEVGYCVSFLHISENYQNPNSNLSEFLAIGTGYMCHEERLARGRMAIYKGTLVHSTDQQDENEIKLQELYNKVFHAPITNIAEVDGYIAAFVGSQLQMIMFINEQNTKVASFLNCHFFSNQLLSMKNYMFYVDAYKGFQMIRWRKYGNKLITVAKDFQTFRPISASLIVHNESFGGAVFDCFGNAQLFEIDEYAIPADAFVIRSVFHIGSIAISSGMFPIKAASDSGANEISGYFGWFVGNSGKFGIFSPIKNDNERRKLCIIQNSFEKSITGFSHQEYRWGKFPLLKNAELIPQSPRLVVDMDLILDLLESHPETQKNCTKLFSRNINDILTPIGEIYSISSIFE